MVSIFLGNADDKIHKVYTDQHKKALSCRAGLCSDRIVSTENIKLNAELTKRAEYAFATWGVPKFTEDELALYLPNLKGLFYAAGSVQHFARPYLNRGIKVYSAWAANAVPVAEYTVAEIILSNKGFFQSCAFQSTARHEEAITYKNHAPGNYHISVGLLGAGMIGKLVISMLKPYNINVLVFDPFLSEAQAKELGVEKVSISNLFERCHVVSNHLANNPQTVGMIQYELLSKLAPYATFINTGRGAQVCEADLIKILKERPTITAVLDVTFPEPPVADSELYKLPNVFLTPHIAGSLGNEVGRMAGYMVMEFEKVIQGLQSQYEVTLPMLETMA